MPVIGIDLGGTKVSGALFSDEGEILFRKNLNVAGKKGKTVGKLVQSVAKNLVSFSARHNYPVTSAGICVPGIAHYLTGNVWAPNIPGWEDYPLKSELQLFLGSEVRVGVESDRTCYILGEMWKGAARGCRDAIYLSVGTGIGAGIIADGRVLHGSGDIAGAVGWMALQPPFADEYVRCGCFEYYASGPGIAEQARKLLGSSGYDRQAWNNRNAEDITPEDVFKAYDNHHPIAVRVIDKAVEIWGMAAANLVSIFNPEKIIFGGGVFGPAARLVDRIYEESCKWAQPVSIRRVKFGCSYLKGDAGIFGSAYLAMKHDYEIEMNNNNDEKEQRLV